jgi:hypothetical protein
MSAMDIDAGTDTDTDNGTAILHLPHFDAKCGDGVRGGGGGLSNIIDCQL